MHLLHRLKAKAQPEAGRSERVLISAGITDLDDVDGPCGNDWHDCTSSIQVRRLP